MKEIITSSLSRPISFNRISSSAFPRTLETLKTVACVIRKNDQTKLSTRAVRTVLVFLSDLLIFKMTMKGTLLYGILLPPYKFQTLLRLATTIVIAEIVSLMAEKELPIQKPYLSTPSSVFIPKLTISQSPSFFENQDQGTWMYSDTHASVRLSVKSEHNFVPRDQKYTRERASKRIKSRRGQKRRNNDEESQREKGKYHCYLNYSSPSSHRATLIKHIIYSSIPKQAPNKCTPPFIQYPLQRLLQPYNHGYKSTP